jgi:hypothetical protein
MYSPFEYLAGCAAAVAARRRADFTPVDRRRFVTAIRVSFTSARAPVDARIPGELRHRSEAYIIRVGIGRP